MSLETWSHLSYQSYWSLFIIKTKGVPHGEEEEEAESALTIDETAKVPVKAVVDGKVIAIEDVKDGIFSEKVLGDGVGIIQQVKQS